jgi:hypothetical protein
LEQSPKVKLISDEFAYMHSCPNNYQKFINLIFLED